MTDARESKCVSIELPSGTVIDVDAVPCEGWGQESGKWYQVIQLDDDGNEIGRHHWSIPAAL